MKIYIQLPWSCWGFIWRAQCSVIRSRTYWTDIRMMSLELWTSETWIPSPFTCLTSGSSCIQTMQQSGQKSRGPSLVSAFFCGLREVSPTSQQTGARMGHLLYSYSLICVSRKQDYHWAESRVPSHVDSMCDLQQASITPHRILLQVLQVSSH